jgi:hypothetical protein
MKKKRKLNLEDYDTYSRLFSTTNPSMSKYIGTVAHLRFVEHSSGLYTAYFGGLINYFFYTSYIKSAVIEDNKLTVTTRNSTYVWLVPETKNVVLIKAPDDLVSTQETKIRELEKHLVFC